MNRYQELRNTVYNIKKGEDYDDKVKIQKLSNLALQLITLLEEKDNNIKNPNGYPSFSETALRNIIK